MIFTTVALAHLDSNTVQISAGPFTAQHQQMVDAALSRMREGMPITIKFMRGDHLFQVPLRVTSGNVTIEGERGSRLTGAVAVRWQPVPAGAIRDRLPGFSKDKAVMATIPGDGPLPFFQVRGFGRNNIPSHAELYTDQGPLWPARYPNPGSRNGGWLLTGDKADANGFSIDEPRIGQWNSTENVWMSGYWKFDWADTTVPLASFDRRDKRISFNPSGKAPESAIRSYGVGAGRRFYFLNVLEELDQLGEYWLDPQSRTVVAILPRGAKESWLSMLGEPIISVEKSHNIGLKDLRIEGSRASGVVVRSSRDVSMVNCQIGQVGDTGIWVDYSTGVTIRDCEIQNSGEGGIILAGGDRKTLTAAKNRVENCWIQGNSRWNRTYTPAVDISGVGNTISHCTLENMPHSAVIIHGNDHMIESNIIRNVCTETGDAGAVYQGRNPTARGTIVRNNWFQSVTARTATPGNVSQVMSVYLDDLQAGAQVLSNVFDSRGMAVLIGGGRDILVKGNVMMGSNPGVSIDARGRNWAKDMVAGEWGLLKLVQEVPVTSEVWRRRYPELYQDVKSNVDTSWPDRNVLDGNVLVGGNLISFVDKLPDGALKEANTVKLPAGTSLTDAIKRLPRGNPRIDLGSIGYRKNR
ncbi:MAG: right-handed parallel beta-helix repeat-containing protein [Armatimonadetes bacterium]|nr:right-handed parallel beta-helix repeat-containing protein [Armatimonadota bacterium]